jgi:hypothetical protein
MEKIDLLNNLLGDIGSFVLVIFGFSVTLFTVLYSFIISKREQLKEYSDKIKAGEQDPLVYQRHSNAILFINSLKKFNRHLIIAIFIDFIVYLCCMFSKYLIHLESVKETFTIVLSITTIVIIVYVSAMLIMTVKDYLRLTKL